MRKYGLGAVVAVALLGACGGDTKVSERSEMWLDRMAIALDQPESRETQLHLDATCDELEGWHRIRYEREANQRNDEEADAYMSDWKTLEDVCNQALADSDWSGARSALRSAYR